MTLSALGIFSAAGAGGVQGDYELIETQIISSAVSSITFTSLATYASTYKHLQIRAVGRTSRGFADDPLKISFNGDTGANYNYHKLTGNGSSVIANGAEDYFFGFTGSTAPTSAYGVAVMDFLDAYSTTKNKTVRMLGGQAASVNLISLSSWLWRNTNAISSITISSYTGSNYANGTRFSLYGIKG